MIIVRSPLRISIGGGGTDLPSYYRDWGGFVVSAAIDKYVYVIMHETFRREILLKYSKLETVVDINQIRHPIIREAAKYLGMQVNFELASMADIPAGTGLGSSGSFTCATLKAFHTYNHNVITPEALAWEACHIEIDRLKNPIGKQDQYISALGGLTALTFNKDDSVTSKKVNISRETLFDLEDHLLLFFTGFARSASTILSEQNTKSLSNDKEMLANLHFVKDIGLLSQKALEKGDLHGYAKMMNDHWEYKKRRSPAMSNPQIDRWYKVGMDNGAMGGKLIGAGGGGFLMFYTDDTARLRHAMAKENLSEVRFRFDFEGTKVLQS